MQQTFTAAEIKNPNFQPKVLFEVMVKGVINDWMDHEIVNYVILNDGLKSDVVPTALSDLCAKIKAEGVKKVKYTTFISVSRCFNISVLTNLVRDRLIEIGA